MPYTTVVAGTAITASWGNANVRDQVVTPFASSAARAAAIGTPVEGMVAWLSDIDQLHAYNGAAWAPAAFARMGGSVRNSDVTMTTTETITDSVTFTAVAGRRYFVLWSGSCYSSASGDSIDIRLRYAAGATVANTDTLVTINSMSEPSANYVMNGTFFAEITGIAAGQTTVGIFGVRIGGTGTIHIWAAANNDAALLIQDVGI